MTPRDTVILRRWLWPVSMEVAEGLAHALHTQRSPDAERDGLTDDEREATSFIADHNDAYDGLGDLPPLRGVRPSGHMRYPIWDNPSGSGSWVVDALQFDYGDVIHAHVCVADALVRRPVQIQPTEGPALVSTSSRRPGQIGHTSPYRFIFDPDVEVGRTYVTTEEMYDNTHVTVVSGPEFCDPIWTQPIGDPKTDIVAGLAYRATYGMYRLDRKDEP